LSENHKSIFEKTSGISNSEIIPWGINPADFPYVTNQLRTIDVVGVGSYIKLKNYTLFIKIIEKLKQSKQDIQALLIGGGIQTKILQNEIIKRKLQDNISIMEQIPRKEVLDLMCKSKILLHTSLYESQGYVFFEAMQLGLKIVSFDIGSAKPSEYWYVAGNKEDMEKGLLDYLSGSREINIEKPIMISETVKKYYNLIFPTQT